jgi:hypothetical protein
VLHRAGAEGIPQPPGAQDTPVDLLLDKFIRETGTPFPGCVPDDILVAYYYAKYPRTRIVVKIVDGAEYPRGKRDVIDEAKSFTMAAAAQGVALPYFVGLFTDGTTYCLVYKVAGRAVKFKQLKDPKVK